MTDTQPPTPDLDTIQAAIAATPGTWWNDGHEIHVGEPGILAASQWIGDTCNVELPDYGEANAVAIVTAHNALPALIARVRDLEQRLDQRTATIADHALANAELRARAASLEAERDGWAENSRNEARIWTARVAELEQQLAAATGQVPQHLRLAIAEDLMELHDDPTTPERYRAGLRYASRRIPHAQDGGY